MIWKDSGASRPFCRRCGKRVGRSAAMCASISAGLLMLNSIPNMRWNCLPSRRTSFWLPVPPLFRRCERLHGLIVTQNTSVIPHRKLIIALAASHRLPAVYASRFFAMDGGLLSFGPNLLDNYRQAAGYVDRILRGEKPADMPVMQPTRYELVINLKTAKALGLEVPRLLLVRADEVIE